VALGNELLEQLRAFCCWSTFICHI